ncbi:unnamed protein product [Fraxinus pennsylvanica]|uniref:Core Histone H2A/H2B/H3 domain-containing protein n=1 Tax=Fraxinus pennsylvanica TaxID=56036 RepID=A0AAD1ZWM7_9LAMI|nr:unnamed protein product [Fraxinus pennsylvanica]
MAPKKRPGKMVKTVVTAKKVVEETVQVVVTSTEKEKGKVEVVSSSTKESENVEVVTSPTEKETVIRSVTVQDNEEPPPKQPAEERDQDETQPASEPETTPQPPKLETPQKEKKRKSPQVKEQGKKKKKIGRAAGEGYKRYIFRVMKQVHPDMGFSSMAMTVINNLMSDMFERIANEAAGLLKFSGRTTLSSREIQGAVKLVLPGELGKHAIAEGTKAVTNYISSISKH